METLSDFTKVVATLQQETAERFAIISAMPEKHVTEADKKTAELQEAKRKAKEKLLVETKARAAKILLEIKAEKKKIFRDIARLRYPSSTSEKESERTIGEQQISNALLLLSTSQSEETLKGQMRTAIATLRIDFASTLYDKLVTSTKNPLLIFSPSGLFEASIEVTAEKNRMELPTELPNFYGEEITNPLCVAIHEIYSTFDGFDEVLGQDKKLKLFLSQEEDLRKILIPIVEPIQSEKKKAVKQIEPSNEEQTETVIEDQGLKKATPVLQV